MSESGIPGQITATAEGEEPETGPRHMVLNMEGIEQKRRDCGNRAVGKIEDIGRFVCQY